MALYVNLFHDLFTLLLTHCFPCLDNFQANTEVGAGPCLSIYYTPGGWFVAPYTIAVVEGLATVPPDHESAVLVILPFGKPHSSCSCHYSYQS